jgi:hypothetical protein
MAPSSTTIDLVDVDYIRAVYIAKDGRQVLTEFVSTDFSQFILCKPESASQAASNLCDSTRDLFLGAVKKVTQDEEFIVKGTLDDRVVSLSGAFDRTYGKAFSACAVNVLRNNQALDRCKVAVPGLLVKNRTALVTLSSPNASAEGKKRGPSKRTLSEEVSTHQSTYNPACNYVVVKVTQSIGAHCSEYQLTLFMCGCTGWGKQYSNQGAEGRNQLLSVPTPCAGSVRQPPHHHRCR